MQNSDKRMRRMQTAFGLSVTIILAFTIGGILIATLGFNPLSAYGTMLRGIFVGKLNIGSVMEKFTPLMLCALAFVLSHKVGFFNLGIEGQLCMGAITTAVVGVLLEGLPGWVIILACFAASIVVAALWAAVPATLKTLWGVNELCTTIMMNYIATQFASYLVVGPFGAKAGAPQTPYIQDSAMLAQIMRPSRANMGIFIALLVYGVAAFLFYRSTVGYRLRSVGSNAAFSDYVGLSSKKTAVITVCVAGAIAGLAGAMEVLGVYGTYVDGMLSGVASDGILAAMIGQMNMAAVPFVAAALAALKVGGLGIERFTGIPKSIVDLIIALVIILICIDGAFQLPKGKRKEK